jgi:membrane-bound metal-dependent hydrolase YbcI (DUF457 family)
MLSSSVSTAAACSCGSRVFLWFLGGSLLVAWTVFHDPSFDYRLLMLGSVLPDLVDAAFGGARVAHALVASVALLVAVMLATIGHRRLRRHLLALPIGTFLHLVLDGVFTTTAVFWWPFAGRFDNARLPSVSRGRWDVALEAVGLVILVWAWRRFGLADRDRRRCFWRTGRLAPVDA